MGALVTVFSFRRLLITAGAMTAILIYVAGVETANATVPKPNRDVTLATYNDHPKGMWSDGTNFFVVESDSRWGGQYLVMSYDVSRGSFNQGADKELASSNDNPTGIWSDGTVVWVDDSGDSKLYAYALSDFSRLADRDIDLAGPNDGIRGLWGFSSTIFVVDKDDARVYAYSTTDGSRQENEEFDLHSDNGNPWGIWGRGTKVWISDVDNDMLYVYERNPNSSDHGDRVPALEIRLPSENDDVRGIWSDGETMWAVNLEWHSKLYAMHFDDFRHPDDELNVWQVGSPTGMWTNGDVTWVADAGRSDHGELLAYDLNDGSRRWGKDIDLQSNHLDPLSMWSDGTIVWVVDDGTVNDFLFAYAMDPEPGEVGLLVPNKSITLHSNNSDPVGTWSDGTTIWVSDSGDDKLFAYDLSGKNRKSGKDIGLHNGNDAPADIWSDGQSIWVLDIDDKHVYAYDLSSGDRRRGKEFSTVPDNDDPVGGLAGHGLRFWIVDGDDEMLYAYGKLNIAPTFSETSARFRIHRTAAPGDLVGSVLGVVDPDGDTVTYLLTGGGLGVFRLDYQTGEIFLRDDAASFSGGEEYTLTVGVSDNKGGLDGLDSSVDDAINVNIEVFHNADPEFTTPDGAAFTVAEDLAEYATIAALDITDLDNDSLSYSYEFTPEYTWDYPISVLEGVFTLRSGKTLDYESTNSYQINVRIRDEKDEAGQTDHSWDDAINFTIQVTNVDEDGEIILGSAHPQVGTAMTVALTDPDGVDLSDGNQVNWVVEGSPGTDVWTEIVTGVFDSTVFGFTPNTNNTNLFLRFKATYKDGYDAVNAKTIEVQTENRVLAEPPSNGAPTFTESSPVSRSIAENAAGGGNAGNPVSATDPDGDTLTYHIVEYDTHAFDVDAGTGQIILNETASLDYESKNTYSVRIFVKDSLDPHGEADDSNDANRLVTIHVTDVEEAGSVVLSSDSPNVDEEITPELSDPDGSITNLTWKWQTADSAESTMWTDISGATSASYTPVAGDIDKFLRAMASYDDGEGSGKDAIGTATNAVERLDNEPPEFDEGASTTRSLEENSVAGTRVGAVVSATDPDGDSLTYSLVSGPDSGLFEIDGSTGRLEVASGAVLDYESDASLEVELEVSDGRAADASQDTAVDATISLTINLINVDEPGSVSLSSNEPEVGTSITAALTDQDLVSSSEWHWEKSQDGVSGWNAIPGAATDSYMPTTSDEGMWLRAMVDYTDGEGFG